MQAMSFLPSCVLNTHFFKIHEVKPNQNKTSKHEYDVTVL